MLFNPIISMSIINFIKNQFFKKDNSEYYYESDTPFPITPTIIEGKEKWYINEIVEGYGAIYIVAPAPYNNTPTSSFFEHPERQALRRHLEEQYEKAVYKSRLRKKKS